MAGINLTRLRKSYTVDRRTVPVLTGLDLSIPENAITVVLGKSGCGKTTLLRLIAGLEPPDSGQISLPGNQRTAFVFQEPRLLPWLSVLDNVQFPLKRSEIRPDETRWMLDTVGLSGFERALPHQLSGGMQQRTALARALLFHPTLILMDEPFAALDHFTRVDMQHALLDIRQKTNASILFVTHSIDEALTLGDTLVILSDGVITARYSIPGQPRDLLSDDMIRLRRRIVASLE
ncbi:MAG: ABC transporter ATP-binding protein [Clostridia bacterium]|nr:ABC transporter ATP-binding protein [Clostridia bacterium]